MASSLDAFLSIDVEEKIIETINAITRDGKEVEVDIKNLPLEQFKQCKKKSTNSYDNPNGGATVAQIEEITSAQKLCALGIVDPPLSNVKLRNKFKVHSNEALVSAMFKPSSIIEMGGRIAQLTLGENEDVPIYDGTDPELVEEAKN